MDADRCSCVFRLTLRTSAFNGTHRLGVSRAAFPLLAVSSETPGGDDLRSVIASAGAGDDAPSNAWLFLRSEGSSSAALTTSPGFATVGPIRRCTYRAGAESVQPSSRVLIDAMPRCRDSLPPREFANVLPEQKRNPNGVRRHPHHSGWYLAFLSSTGGHLMFSPPSAVSPGTERHRLVCRYIWADRWTSR